MKTPELIVAIASGCFIAFALIKAYVIPWHNKHQLEKEKVDYDAGYDWAMIELQAGIEPQVVFDAIHDKRHFMNGACAALHKWMVDKMEPAPVGSSDRLNADLRRKFSKGKLK